MLLSILQGIDPVAQIILAVGIIIVVVIALIVVWIKGLKAGGKNGIMIGSSGNMNLTLDSFESLIDVITESLIDVIRLNEAESVNRKMDFAEDRISLIRNLKEQLFYKISKDRVQENVLTSNEDLNYYNMLVGNALFSDNGAASLKSLIRKYLKGNEYKVDGRDFDNFLKDFTDIAIENWRRYINTYYKTEVIKSDGSKRERVVTAKELYHANTDQRHRDDLEDIFRQIFTHAKSIDEKITKEKKDLFDKRKKRIEQIIGIKTDDKKD